MDTHHTAPPRPQRLFKLVVPLLLAWGGAATAQISFYEHDDFRGRVFATQQAVSNLSQQGFNDRASSVVVERGRWEVCDDANFRGRCVLLRPGSYSSLRQMGLNDKLSSVRAVRNKGRYAEDRVPEPLQEPAYAWRQRDRERLYDAPVTSVRAVYAAETERCWMEHENAKRDDPNVGRGLLGAVIGGVIGHQIGGGTGRDLATAAGAVTGAVVGANSGRDRQPAREVQRCAPDRAGGAGTLAYWDVGYTHRGVHHQVQMRDEPGRTVRVNAQGEPRQ